MRFVYTDPYALRGAVQQLAGQQPVATRRERDLPIPVDVYQQIVYRDVGVKSNRRKARSK